MEAKVGDELVIDARHMGEPRRMGEILEILHQGDVVHYRVRWDDGHESIFFPSSDAHVVHPRPARR